VPDNILVVDDDPGAIQQMGRILEGLGTVRFATTGADAIRCARDVAPDLILLDAEMPGMSGFKVFDSLKAIPDLGDIPIIFVTSHSEPDFEVGALAMGASDFISKPVNPPLVKARVRTHLRAKHCADELRRNASTDGLTGIANRRCFDETLDREWLRAARHNEPLSLLLIDVDHFKLYNDRYGHPQGDACLLKVVEVLKQSVQRKIDLIARCGGEEFAVLLPETPRGGAECVAQRILSHMASRRIRHEASPTAQHLTLSVGIASYDEADANWSRATDTQSLRGERPPAYSSTDLLLTADRALYRAKRAGRAQACLVDIAETVASPLAGGPTPPVHAIACA
jgi:diguanylate cyclase (GGDEF)-like protein